MQPPQWVLDKIEELHPLCRLGYAGGNEIAIVELWRVREAPTTMLGSPFYGKVYGSYYDPLERIPLQIMAASLDEVWSGQVIDAVKIALSNFKERAIAAHRERGQEEQRELEALAEDLGDRWWHAQQQTGAARGDVVLESQITADDRAVATGEWSAANDWSNKYVDRMQESEGVPIK